MKLRSLLLTCYIASAFSLFACPKYKVLDLGTFTYSNSEALQINDNLDILGNFENGAFFFWSIDTGFKGFGRGSTKMNSTGRIALSEERSCCQGRQFDIFTLDPKSNKRMGLGFRDGNAQKVVAINNLNQIIFEGNSGLSVWSNNGIKQIHDLFDRNHPIFINDKSEIYGTAKSPYGYLVARCYQLDTGKTFDINPSMKKNFQVVNINKIGQAIIHWKSATEEGAFLWPLGQQLPLTVRKINDAGQMLDKDTYFWDKGQKYEINSLLDLEHDQNTPFEKIVRINDINNDGIMVGKGLVNGCSHAVLIVPMKFCE